MPDIPETLSNAERKLAADRLWRIVHMCDAGRPVSDIREAVKFTATAIDNPAWDGLANKPSNLEAA